MTARKKSEREALDLLADVLVEDILATSDKDILAELKEDNIDAERLAPDMRALFERSILVANKRRLLAAKAGVVASSPSNRAAATTINIQDARRRLRAVLETKGVSQRLTLAARKESELSDADILNMVEDLQDLGLMPPDGGQDGKT